MIRTFLRWFVVSVVSAIGVPLVATTTIVGSLIFLPLPATLPNPKAFFISRPSVVLDATGNQIATFSEFDQSVPVQQGDIPLVLKQALIASEDKNFYKEGGVDPRGSLRAIVRDFQGTGYVQGGSTITQQYVKNAYTDKKRTVTRKLREAVLASQLARSVPKDEILYKYLDSVYLGDGAYGVGAAAETYFRKRVNDLTIGEAALLVGLIPAPSRYEPRGNQVLAEERRKTVLSKMLEQRYITQQQYDFWRVAQVYEATAPPLPAGAPQTLVYPPKQDVTQYPFFVDYVRRFLEDDPTIGPNLLYRGGLRIQTTVDPTIQKIAEQSVADTLAGTAPPLEMALVSVEPQTGHVRAMVGGRDFGKDQTNLALGGCEKEVTAPAPPVVATCVGTKVPVGGGTGRQPGSSFKPFVLATAFDDGVQPTEVFNGPSQITLPNNCRGSGCQVIHNAGDSESGQFTLAQATWFSVNTVYAQLILDPRVTIQRTAEMAKKLGVTNAWFSPRVHGASYALGALDVSPLDMASAYGVFDNHGLRVPPTPIVRIVDPNGKTLVDNTAPAGTQVIRAAVADNVTNVLRGVITDGTGNPNANIGRPAVGKTGTTSSFVDAWFVGYVPTLSTSVWMGYKDSEDPSKHQMLNVCSAKRGCASPVFGGTLPAATWADFMKQATANVPPTDFTQPAPLTRVANAINGGGPGDPGLAPGYERSPVVIGSGGPYQYGPGSPVANAPPTTAPPAAPTTTTFGGGSTTTTNPARPPPVTVP